MKSTPAVFLTSLAVSAFSLTIPLPTATTVLNLFIGEDISVQHIAQAEEETSKRNTHRVERSLRETACPDSKEKADFKADAPRASVSECIPRLLPDCFLEQLTRVYETTQHFRAKYTAYNQLANRPMMSNGNDRVSIRRERLLLRERLSNTALTTAIRAEQRVKRLYRVAGVSSPSFLRSM